MSWLQQRDSEYLYVLRAVSIFVIVLGHVGGFWFWRPWSEFLHVSVPVFFFVSGAVSYNSFLQGKSLSLYIKKRVTGLIIPYYCICFLALLVYLVLTKRLPKFSLGYFLDWLTITPGNKIMPFPLGQVWFLHTLLIIPIISPVFFFLYQKRSFLFPLFLVCSVLVSFIQMKSNISPTFMVAGHNLFEPLVHSLFFCLGFLILDLPKLHSASFSITAGGVFLGLSVFLVKILNLNPDYGFHTFPPDFYYVAGSLCTIWALVSLQDCIMKVYRRFPLVHGPVRFLFRHTFAIYLLHTFGIFLAEEVFGLAHPEHKDIIYGVFKLFIVLGITFSISLLFTKVSSLITELVLRLMSRRTLTPVLPKKWQRTTA